MYPFQFSVLTPSLDSEVLDLDVTGPRCRATFIDNVDIRQIVRVYLRGPVLEQVELLEDKPEVPCHFGACNASVKLRFCGAGRSYVLETRLVCDDSTAVNDHDACDRSSGFRLSRVGSVVEAYEFVQLDVGEWGQFEIRAEEIESTWRELHERPRATIHDAPIFTFA